ncbi:DUF1801 domain-containing protein [Actinoplanes sp. CA-142083]|uniref:DUF1801 domain-containing protein n=1 Tax=Actinoplanes sp. CA-142083 TaxID=3239903 RepID=UPI003D91CB72
MTDIDDYLSTRLDEKQAAIVQAIRDQLRRHAPGSREVISRGSLAWRGRQLIAIVSLSRTHVTLAFARGAEFSDPHQRLEGAGKTTRHLKVRSPAQVTDALMADYVRQAVSLDLDGS